MRGGQISVFCHFYRKNSRRERALAKGIIVFLARVCVCVSGLHKNRGTGSEIYEWFPFFSIFFRIVSFDITGARYERNTWQGIFVRS